MSIIQKKPFKFVTTTEKTKNLPKLGEKKAFPLFSYSVSTDIKKSPITSQLNQLKFKYKNITIDKEKAKRNYLSNRVVKSKDGINIIDYDERIKRDINEDINYKNSFIDYSYDSIKNCSPFFITLTLGGDYHLKTKGQNNKELQGLEGKELAKAISFLHYKGYSKIRAFSPTLRGNRIFRNNQLTTQNRASITALEPHKDWTPHEHQLHFIDNTYTLGFIKAVVNTVLKLGLGRTQIVATKRDLEEIKKHYNLKEKVTKDYKQRYIKEYHLENTPVFFQEFIIKDGNELKSVSNYLSSYVETKHVLDDNKQDKKAKKQILEYHGYAYYLAHLKDMYEPKKEYSKYHKKIRRINYTQQLISRSVYKRVMTKHFIQHLKDVNEYEPKNMYYKATTMLKRNELKIYKYQEVFARREDNSPKYEKNNVNYYNFTYKGYDELVDCKSYDIYKVDPQTKKFVLEHKSKQIDLAKDDFIIIEYKLERNANKYINESALAF